MIEQKLLLLRDKLGNYDPEWVTILSFSDEDWLKLISRLLTECGLSLLSVNPPKKGTTDV